MRSEAWVECVGRRDVRYEYAVPNFYQVIAGDEPGVRPAHHFKEGNVALMLEGTEVPRHLDDFSYLSDFEEVAPFPQILGRHARLTYAGI